MLAVKIHASSRASCVRGGQRRRAGVSVQAGVGGLQRLVLVTSQASCSCEPGLLNLLGAERQVHRRSDLPAVCAGDPLRVL